MPTDTRGPARQGLGRDEHTARVVSVIIPAYNAAGWIESTIASVRAQTYHAIEIVVADDGSRDGTAERAEALGATVVRTSGVGPGGARNAGLDAATGEFIQFLDADDMLAPGKIGRQIALLASTGADIAWEPFHHLVPTESSGTFELGRRVVPTLTADLAASLLSAKGFMQIGAVLIRRTPITDGVRFLEGREAVEDVRYLVELAMRGARFVSSESPELGLLFRQHRGPRYSNRPAASFARGCATNAMWAETEWKRGGLTDEQRVVLGEAYAFAARQLAGIDAVSFREIAARGASHGDAFLRHLPAQVRWLTRVVGYQRAESIAVSWRRARSSADGGDSMEAR
jgi:hypothetical protein